MLLPILEGALHLPLMVASIKTAVCAVDLEVLLDAVPSSPSMSHPPLHGLSCSCQLVSLA